jgi:hypothetical protein
MERFTKKHPSVCGPVCEMVTVTGWTARAPSLSQTGGMRTESIRVVDAAAESAVKSVSLPPAANVKGKTVIRRIPADNRQMKCFIGFIIWQPAAGGNDKIRERIGR